MSTPCGALRCLLRFVVCATFTLTFYPPITFLAHFHPLRKPPQQSRPDGNTRFPANTFLLLEVSFVASDDQTPEGTTAQGRTSKPSANGVASLLLLSPLHFLLALATNQCCGTPAPPMFRRWTQRVVVAEFSSTTDSSPMLLIRVTWLPML